MMRDGTEARNIKYQDVCPDAVEAAEPKKQITVAYNNDMWLFHYYKETNTMLDFPLWLTLEKSEKLARIPKSWEIIRVLFVNYNLEPIWIDCNRVWGWFDEETNSWTGAVGQVFRLINQ